MLVLLSIGIAACLLLPINAVRAQGQQGQTEASQSQETQAQESLADAAAVVGVFEGYKAALMAGDGETAATLVDAGTLVYFGELQRLALTADEPTLKARTFVDRLLVVSMRQVLAPADLEVLELGDLMNLAVSEGWISPETVSQLDIGAVTVSGDQAVAEALSASLPTNSDDPEGFDLHYQFFREQGAWKFGFSSLVDSLSRLVSEFTAQLGTDQDELIFLLVQSLTGKPVLPSVWQRPEPVVGESDPPPRPRD